MEPVLDVVPGGARFHGDRFRLLVDLDAVELAHVENQGMVVEGMAAHGMPNGGHRDLESVVTGEGERRSDILPAAHFDNAVDGRARKPARIIQRTALQRPGKRRVMLRETGGCRQVKRAAIEIGHSPGVLWTGRIAGKPRHCRARPCSGGSDCRAAKHKPS